eukprot:evm.model.scf_478.1 EVM.evm.TU.scf_478.1   scf_478:3982-7675(+)
MHSLGPNPHIYLHELDEHGEWRRAKVQTHWTSWWSSLAWHVHPKSLHDTRYGVVLVELPKPTSVVIPVFTFGMNHHPSYASSQHRGIPLDVPMYALQASIDVESTQLLRINSTDFMLTIKGRNSKRTRQCGTAACVPRLGTGTPVVRLDHPPRETDTFKNGSHELDVVVAMATTDGCCCTSYVLMADVMDWVSDMMSRHESPWMQKRTLLLATVAVALLLAAWLIRRWRHTVGEDDAVVKPGDSSPSASPRATPQGSEDGDRYADGDDHAHGLDSGDSE